MSSQQKVRYHKLLGLLSAFDPSRVETTQYKQLKSQTKTISEIFSDLKFGTGLLERQIGSQQKLRVSKDSSFQQEPREGCVTADPTIITKTSSSSSHHNRSSSMTRFSRIQQRRQANLSQGNLSVATISSAAVDAQMIVLPINPMTTINPIPAFSLNKSELGPVKSSQYSFLKNNSPRKSILQPLNIVEEDSRQQHSAWSEVKFSGRLCEGRSFSVAISHGSSVFFYGGYDSTRGVLRDFIELRLEQNEPSTFHQVKLDKDNIIYPGRLCRYGAVKRGDSMFIFGGKSSSLSSTNAMYEFSFKSKTFRSIPPNLSLNEGDSQPSLMPSIDSHSLTYDIESDSMVLFGGYISEPCGYSNGVYKYHFPTATWKCVLENHHQQQQQLSLAQPQPRGSHGAVIKDDHLFIFGGSAGEIVFSDLWEMNLMTNVWTLIDTSSQPLHPGPRSGISLWSTTDFLVTFGGFKSLTNEKNEVSVFSLKTREWVYHTPQSVNESTTATIAEQDVSMYVKVPSRFSNAIENRSGISSDSTRVMHERSRSSARINGQGVARQQQQQYSSRRIMLPLLPLLVQREEESETIIRQRDVLSKVDTEKKRQLLKIFEVDEKDRIALLSPAPIVQSMNSSLQMLGPCMASAHFEAANLQHITSKLHQISESRITGKLPGARDGYISTEIAQGKILIFGGDRHRMSFNDTYVLDLHTLLGEVNRS